MIVSVNASEAQIDEQQAARRLSALLERDVRVLVKQESVQSNKFHKKKQINNLKCIRLIKLLFNLLQNLKNNVITKAKISKSKFSKVSCCRFS